MRRALAQPKTDSQPIADKVVGRAGVETSSCHPAKDGCIAETETNMRVPLAKLFKIMRREVDNE
jgi:hypothetical protein